MNLSLQEDSDYVKVFVDELLHIHFLRKYYRGMQAYHENVYTVDILLKDQTIKLEYDKREHWEAILRVLNTAL